VKLIIFKEYLTSNPFHNLIAENIRQFMGDECLIWDSSYQKNYEYFTKTKDSRMYEAILDYCQENNVEYLHIAFLTNPELFLAELDYRDGYREIRTKISFAMDWRLVEISRSRQFVVSQILKRPYIDKMFIHSSLGGESQYMGDIETDFFLNCSKIVKYYNPIYVSDIKPLSRNRTTDKFVFLFFGAMYYGKGIDILCQAMKLVDRDILLRIVSGEDRFNFEMDKSLLEQPNIIWEKRNIENSEMSEIFADCDAFVLPYRLTYFNCASSVLVQACQAHKPVIMPKITPFKEVMVDFNIGCSFRVEDIFDLADSMNMMKHLVHGGYRFTGFDDYISRHQTWEQYVKKILE
jgi:glycosyltransferase involved in cell wall biosynthesis